MAASSSTGFTILKVTFSPFWNFLLQDIATMDQDDISGVMVDETNHGKR